MSPTTRRALVASALAGAVAGAFAPPAAADTSALWGQGGELWDPRGRLPDFSYAGYRAGREPIPDLPVVTNVRDFGAVGDGTTDDTAAFQAALAATENGALLVPAGRYVLRGKLEIERSNVVLRGEGPDATVINIDASLTDLNGGVKDPNYSYGSAFIEVSSTSGFAARGTVVSAARRGDRRITVDSVADIEPGDMLRLKVVEPDGSTALGLHLHNGQAEAARCGDTRVQFNWRVVVAEVDEASSQIVLDEPLPIDLRLEWGPSVGEYHYVNHVGIEDLTIEFPVTPYPGHLQEFGYNAIMFTSAMDSWVRNVTIENADSGIFARGKHLTAQNVRMLSDRPADASGRQGHHGISGGQGNLFDGIHFETNFGHHITVSNQATRSVYRNVSGTVTVRLDHHRRTPIENLFTAFTAPWSYRSGGSGCEGPHAGARNTYWGMRGPVGEPCNVGGSGQCWGHIQSTIVADLAVPESLTEDREWYEEVADLEPHDLYAAQLSRRLRIEDRDASFSPLRFGSRSRFVEDDWTRWAVVEQGGDDRYALMTTVHEARVGERLGEHSLVATNSLGDVSVTARAASLEPLDSRYRDVALILGYQDDDNYDYAMFNSDEVSTEIFAVRDGQRHAIANAERGVLTDTDWHDIGFRRSGTMLEMLWDGEVIASGDLADAGFTALPGRVGVGTYNDAAFFDDIAIDSPDLAEDEPDAGVGGGDDAGVPIDGDVEGAGCGCSADGTSAGGLATAALCLLGLAVLRRRSLRPNPRK